MQNETAKLKEELSEIKVQHNYFNRNQKESTISIPKIRNINKITSDTIMRLKTEYEDLQTIGLWFRLKSQLFYGIGNT